MTSRFLNLMFSPAVKSVQEAYGSRHAYARRDGAGSGADRLTESEMHFIASRDSFYMASTGADGWPYIQHRGGPIGFVKILSDRSIGFADFRGNRQYVSVGNIHDNNKVSLFFMDYGSRARLKLLGRAKIVDLSENTELSSAFTNEGYRAETERGLAIDVEAFDWNCSQHITPRYTLAELEPSLDKFRQKIAELEKQLQNFSSK